MSSIDRTQHQVLVVDDDDTLRRMTSLVLRRAGLEVKEARDGADAIDCLGGAAYDVMVLDLMMPGVNGWQVVAWLRENPQVRPRVVLVLTAAVREVLNEIDPEVVNTILFKPYDIHQFVAYVKACCEGLDLESLNSPNPSRLA